MDNFALNLVGSLIDQNYDEIRERALQDYVVPGFTSLVLHRSEKLTIRLYVVRKGESRLANTLDPYDNSLWIHDHRFDFECQTLAGYMANLRFIERAVGTTKDAAWGTWYKYRYESALTRPDRQIEVVPLGMADLELREINWVREGQSYYMPHTQYHRILVPKGCSTVMLFWEHERIPKDSILFSREELPKHPSTEGLYHRMGEYEFNELVDFVLDLLGGWKDN